MKNHSIGSSWHLYFHVCTHEIIDVIQFNFNLPSVCPGPGFATAWLDAFTWYFSKRFRVKETKTWIQFSNRGPVPSGLHCEPSFCIRWLHQLYSHPLQTPHAASPSSWIFDKAVQLEPPLYSPHSAVWRLPNKVVHSPLHSFKIHGIFPEVLLCASGGMMSCHIHSSCLEMFRQRRYQTSKPPSTLLPSHTHMASCFHFQWWLWVSLQVQCNASST